jgi:glycosyltransferase involved in cell wall biosynthesis
MDVSFCITCKNRLHQLMETLPRNLWDCRGAEGSVEFVLVDFGSTDGVLDWVVDHHGDALRSGLLKLFTTQGLPRFHASIAKNTAHRMGSGTILTNLDVDNFVGPAGGRYVARVLQRGERNAVFHQWSGVWGDGTYGRISCSNEAFHTIRGYDEAFHHAGYQDTDLLNRLSAGLGLELVREKANPLARRIYRVVWGRPTSPRHSRAIPNEKTATIADHDGGAARWSEWDTENRARSEANLAAGRFAVNPEGMGVREEILQWVDGGFERVP